MVLRTRRQESAKRHRPLGFVKKDQAMEQAVAATREMIRGELGDARSFPLDSPKSRQPRIEWLRAQ